MKVITPEIIDEWERHWRPYHYYEGVIRVDLCDDPPVYVMARLWEQRDDRKLGGTLAHLYSDDICPKRIDSFNGLDRFEAALVRSGEFPLINNVPELTKHERSKGAKCVN